MAETATLAEALVAALSDLTVVEAKRTAKIQTNKGRDYEYQYADIGDVVKMTRPVLAQHGLVALTPVHDHGNGLACTVTLIHTSGERLDLGPFPFEPGRDAQSTGSAVTYHRRYALVAALGMAAGDDDDGSQATASARQPRYQPPPAPPISEAHRHEIEAAIAALDAEQTDALKAEWKRRKLRKLEALTADDVDAVHELIVQIEAGAPA